MAKAAARASTLTTLVIGQVKVPIGLFSTQEKPGGLVKFDRAGPSGGKLLTRLATRPVPVAEQVDQPAPVAHSDPFADDPGSELPGEGDGFVKVGETHMLAGAKLGAAAAAAPAEGEYASELVEEGTGEVVPPENVRRGVRLEDGRFVDCTERIAQIEADTQLEVMEVVGFVPITSVERARVVKAYYLAPADADGPVAMRMLLEAMRGERRVGVVKVTKRSRQSLGIVGWLGHAMMFYELVWAEDFRPAPAKALTVAAAQVREDQVEMARELVRAMSLPASALDEMRDDAIALREALYEAALRGEVEQGEPWAGMASETQDATDKLLSQLEASLAAAS